MSDLDEGADEGVQGSSEDDVDGSSVSSVDEEIVTSTSNVVPDPDADSQGVKGWLVQEAYLWSRDVFLGLVFVGVIFALLAAAVGVWPPLMAVESGSMSPHLNQGDIVVVSEPGRFSSSVADENGIVTYRTGKEVGVTSFNMPGSVIVFGGENLSVSADQGTIHRPMFTVEEGENWYNQSNTEFVHGADSCDELRNCPAPNAGYITKGDNNDYYDQAIGISPPVKSDWVVATAEFRVPYVGYIRLIADFFGF